MCAVLTSCLVLLFPYRLPLKIVEFSQYAYDWDRDTLKVNGKWVLNSPNDDYLYFVEYTEKIDSKCVCDRYRNGSVRHGCLSD